MNQAIVKTLEEEAPGPNVRDALLKLIENDFYLLEIDANERSLTHRVAMYLQELFPNWNVDCEYNRDRHEPKELYLEGGEPDSYDTNAQTVYPDIIIHKRGTPQNHLVIEFKKTSSNVGSEKDFRKLRAFRVQLGYEYALFIELGVGHVDTGISRAEWVRT